MRVKYPCVEVDLKKLEHNTEFLVGKCRETGIGVFGVTKVFCGDPKIANTMIRGGVEALADSRIINLRKLKQLDCKKILLRLPEKSEAQEIVRNIDISLNSEIETMEELSKAAQFQNKYHDVILMVDLGDLREGIMESNLLEVAREVIKLPNIKLRGIGTNLTCYGGVIPEDNNLGRLVSLKNQLEIKLGIELEVVSGGNSSSLYKVFEKTMVKGINNLRLGEGIVLGRETAFGNKIDGCYNDVFTLKGEIIELKEKPSMPMGTIGMDAFGNIPKFKDKGKMKRAIIDLGKQDIRVEGLMSRDEALEIIGASSDHLIINLSNSKTEYRLGDVLEFSMDYGCLLKVMTSPYIEKVYIE